MSASERVKAAGLKSLKHMSQLSGRDTSTLKQWHATRPDFFEVVLAGCVPRGGWRPLKDLLAEGYEGRVVYKTVRALEFTGFIRAGRVWNAHTVQAIPANDIVEVLKYV